MKKIINGKRYDTDTATSLGADSYSNTRDFNYWYEELYRKQTGEFFLYGEGGAASKYAVSVGQNSWEGGSKIIPLSIESAKEWAEEHLSADLYEEAFGEVDEGGEKTTVTIRLTEKAIKELKDMAAAQEKPMSEIVEELILNKEKDR